MSSGRQGRREILAVISTQGGARSIARQYAAMVAGKPLIVWLLEECAKSSHVTRVAVSTDDPELAALARAHRAEVVRPAQSSAGDATLEQALLRALEQLREGSERYEPDYVACLHCGSPLTTVGDIDGAIDAALGEQADAVVAVTDFRGLLWSRGPEGSAVGINHEFGGRAGRRDTEPQHRETGALYVLRTQGFVACGQRHFGKVALWNVPNERAHEIDESGGLSRCEWALSARRRAAQSAALPVPLAAVVFDFDGVFTDNRVLVMQSGEEGVLCSRADGLGLDACRKIGVPMLVLSTETNPVVRARCQKLRLECIQGQADKRAALEQWVLKNGVDAPNVVYVGNDINDLGCLSFVGCPVATADAHPLVRSIARIVLSRNGGDGAVREVAELVADHISACAKR